MLTPVLTAADIAVLQRALALAATDGAAAERALLGLPGTARSHPDALFVLSRALRSQGRLPEARASLERAVVAAPRNARLWNSLGNLLDDLGDADAAIGALQHAVALSPNDVEAWTNLAIVATGAGQFAVAEAAAARAVTLDPVGGAALAAKGALDQAMGRSEAAAVTLRRALDIDPGNQSARHNLAAALRALDEQESALDQLDRALAAGAANPATATMRAHVLAELGRFDDAVDQYRAVLDVTPGHIDAHETLARLLPQLGRRVDALDNYRRALSAAPAPELLRSAIAAARDLCDSAAMFEWIAVAERTMGRSPELALAKVSALTLAGDHRAAVAAAEALAVDAPSLPGLQIHLAHLYLAGGDPARAEGHALAASRAAPLDQSPWALLTLIWRLTGDRREAWLADYERLVMTAELPVPGGWASGQAFLGDLAAALTKLHLTSAAPAEQSLRGGSQTRGNLFDRRDPVIRAFAGAVQETGDRLLAALPVDPSHPFLRRNTGRLAFAGSWSVRLRAQGFHVSHIHAAGWLSSAFYVAVPPEVAADGGVAGKLLLGVPDAALRLDLPPRRVVAPLPGRLVLFPSYFWHGTAPFESAVPRLTAAFDALPA